MRPVGFSTGALAKGDFVRGLDLQRGVARIDSVELSALRDVELSVLVDAVPSLDLDAFTYVSFHAPSSLRTLDEETVFALLQRLPETWPIVVHPDVLQTPSLWVRLGAQLCIENMDIRKTTGRTPSELRDLFAIFPAATFCLDLGHARQIDPTMASALLMLREFGDRLRQLHVSDVGARGEHLPLGATARHSFARLAHHVPADCPIIIESVIEAEAMERELDSVRAALDAVTAEFVTV
ncbi:MAG TPA: hypothetical protein VF883_03580 [Thermoanaerobaculia bacterium]|jgi:hypothetical protein